MEAVTLGETINYIVDNSSKVVDKAVEAMNDLGRKMQQECGEKKASENADKSPEDKAE